MEKLQDTNLSCDFVSKFKIFKGYTLSKRFEKYMDEIENFEVYDDDVWVTSYPKSGTTWTQEMVWCMCNNLDFDGAKEYLDIRFPFLEYYNVTDAPDPDNKIPFVVQSVGLVKNMKRPRFIKTHLPWDLLPKQIRNFEKRPKIIHVRRNPKDACVSYFHHSKIFRGYTGDIKSYAKLFITANVPYSPVIKTILSYWKFRDEPNILFIKYEDMKKDLSLVIKQVAAFLNVTMSDDQIPKLVNHLSFENMKKNKFVDHSLYINFLKETNASTDKDGCFIRKGVVGSHKTEMSSETICEFDQWMEKELMNTGLKF